MISGVTVRCPSCGVETGHVDQLHLCRSTPPVSSAEWASATRRVISFAAFFAAAAVASAFLAGSLADLTAATDDADPAARAGLALGAMVLGLLALGSMLGLLISWLFWWRSARRLGRAYGVPAYGHLGYWGAGLFAAALVASYLYPALLDDTTDALLVQAGMRLAGVVVLVAGVVHTRAWLRKHGGDDFRPYAADRYSLVTGGDPVSPISAQPTADDWDASSWDPDVQRDIDRRRERS
jgi:hypothetical protein